MNNYCDFLQNAAQKEGRAGERGKEIRSAENKKRAITSCTIKWTKKWIWKSSDLPTTKYYYQNRISKRKNMKNDRESTHYQVDTMTNRYENASIEWWIRREKKAKKIKLPKIYQNNLKAFEMHKFMPITITNEFEKLTGDVDVVEHWTVSRLKWDFQS